MRLIVPDGENISVHKSITNTIADYEVAMQDAWASTVLIVGTIKPACPEYSGPCMGTLNQWMDCGFLESGFLFWR